MRERGRERKRDKRKRKIHKNAELILSTKPTGRRRVNSHEIGEFLGAARVHNINRG